MKIIKRIVIALLFGLIFGVLAGTISFVENIQDWLLMALYAGWFAACGCYVGLGIKLDD